jgi:hypothetical protein
MKRFFVSVALCALTAGVASAALDTGKIFEF